MSFIIGNKCVDVCDTACVAVCPVDCIHGPIDPEGMGAEVAEIRERGESLDGKQLYINPETCIDCGACEPECPVEAIYPSEEDVPNDERESIRRNYEFFGQDVPEEWR